MIIMTTRRKFVLSTLGLIGAPSYSLAGWKTLQGNEDYAWKDGAYSLIIAEVKEISGVSGDKKMGTHKATLNPVATLAGTLDPGATFSLDVRLYCGVGSTSIPSAPLKGATVIAVLRGIDYVASDDCAFMPDRSALVTIDGFADKRVMETIRKLRLTRHPEEADILPEIPKERGDGVKPAPPGNK